MVPMGPCDETLANRATEQPSSRAMNQGLFPQVQLPEPEVPIESIGHGKSTPVRFEPGS